KLRPVQSAILVVLAGSWEAVNTFGTATINLESRAHYCPARTETYKWTVICSKGRRLSDLVILLFTSFVGIRDRVLALVVICTSRNTAGRKRLVLVRNTSPVDTSID
ncbi:hypothetical protein BaRGS_00025450, partial [Batillaria attramentaria]